MIYLRPIAKKLIHNPETLAYVEGLKDDKAIMNVLLEEVDLMDIEIMFTKHYGTKYRKLDLNEINSDVFKSLDKKFFEEKVVMPIEFTEHDKTWHFAIGDLTSRDLQKSITGIMKKAGYKANFTFAFPFEIKEAYKYIDNKSTSKPKPTAVDNAVSRNATEWVDTIIDDGIELRASDIHIERVEEGLRVRYRVDGSMTPNRMFPMSDTEISNIYVRLKILGDMDISEKRRSQDGRINDYEYNGEVYSLRVSTINTILGEKFVMRVLSESGEIAGFSELGFDKSQEEIVVNMINNSNGIIYLAGATGSGKTTTLYAMIDKLDKDTLNIYTIENPSEKTIDGISQIQVDEASGNTYPSVLKALLRQDPDVMVVGEIREAETSRLAVQASLTGHLVMTTVHANNALDSVNRLLDMGVESYLIGSSSVGFISQKLVRLLCEHCKEPVEHLPEHHDLWIKEKISNFNYEAHKANDQYIYEARGCDKCVNGYRGRIAAIEIINVNNTIKSMISKKVDSKELRDYLYSNGYRDMKHDGILKALRGIISVDELMSKL